DPLMRYLRFKGGPALRVLAALGLGVFSLGGAPAWAATSVTVNTVTALFSAVAAAKPGETINVAPGTYVFPDRLRLNTSNPGVSGSPITLIAQQGPGTVTFNANCNEEGIYVAGASFWIVDGFKITNGQYHGIKIDNGSTDIVLRNNVIFNNTCAWNAAADPTEQYSGVKGGGTGPVNGLYAERVTLSNNEIYLQNSGYGGTNLQGIDCNGCKDWTVDHNYVHDMTTTNATLSGTGIQFKSGSAGTMIDSNRVARCGLVGIDYGGFGTASWGGETHQHVGGIVRNNVVWGNADAGISAVDTQDGKVYNNTLFNNGHAPDVRVASVNLSYKNNILDAALDLRDGTTASSSNNLALSAPSNGSLFVNATGADFHLASTAAAAIDQGASLPADVPVDADGLSRPQGAAFDIGAYEFKGSAPPPDKTSPVIASGPSATPATLTAGQTSALTVAAHDPDNLDSSLVYH